MNSNIAKYGQMVIRLMFGPEGKSLKDAVNDVSTTYSINADELYVYVSHHSETK